MTWYFRNPQFSINKLLILDATVKAENQKFFWIENFVAILGPRPRRTNRGIIRGCRSKPLHKFVTRFFFSKSEFRLDINFVIFVLYFERPEKQFESIYKIKLNLFIFLFSFWKKYSSMLQIRFAIFLCYCGYVVIYNRTVHISYF